MKWRYSVSILLLLLLVFILPGCGRQEAETPVGVDTTPVDTQPSPVTGVTDENGTTVPEEWKADGIIGANEYQHMVSRSGFEVYYTIDDTYAYFGLKAQTTGWVAIGFEPSSRMMAADMVLGMVVNGEVIVSDQYSTGLYGPHTADTELGGTDDILEYGGSEENGFTIIEFKRLRITGDKFDNDITGDSMNIIIAYGSRDDFSAQHSYRQAFRINLN